jgi:hypothetical protein
MIYQRPSSNHVRDREIANMPLETVHIKGEPWWVSLLLWLAMALIIIMFGVLV